jgi:arylsulfatase A-like enzyme
MQPYDLLPTFYELAGGKGSMPAEVDGGSLVKLFGDPGAAKVKRPFDGLVFHRPHYSDNRMSALRRGDLKFVLKWQDNGKIAGRELYDVGTNPTEEGRNVIGKHANVAKQLETDLLAYLKSVNAEMLRKRPQKKK